ncbi:MAG: hypothetical protein WDA00_06545 [Eubacteriales bacterium]
MPVGKSSLERAANSAAETKKNGRIEKPQTDREALPEERLSAESALQDSAQKAPPPKGTAKQKKSAASKSMTPKEETSPGVYVQNSTTPAESESDLLAPPATDPTSPPTGEPAVNPSTFPTTNAAPPTYPPSIPTVDPAPEPAPSPAGEPAEFPVPDPSFPMQTPPSATAHKEGNADASVFEDEYDSAASTPGATARSEEEEEDMSESSPEEQAVGGIFSIGDDMPNHLL